MKRKTKKQKRFILGISITCVLLIIISIFVNETIYPGENLLKDITVGVQKIIMYPFTLKKDKLLDQSKSELIQKNINSSLTKEIQELKETLELNRTLTEYEPINATILSRNKAYWFHTITIDKGSSSGIKRNMAVVTKNGLVGKITKVSKYSSEVKLITTDDINFKVSIAIKTNEFDNYAILNGYDVETGLDIVLTSGLGEMFPGGIYIGTVEKVESDKYNLSKTAYIKTYQNFNDIHYVTVLKVKE